MTTVVQMPVSLFQRKLVLLAAFLGSFCLANAHDPGLSTASLRLDSSNLVGQLIFSTADVDLMLGLEPDARRSILNGERAGAAEKVDSMAPEALEVTVNGREVEPLLAHAGFDSSNNVTVLLSFPMGRCSNLVVRSKWLALMPDGHRQFFTLRRTTNGVPGSSQGQGLGGSQRLVTSSSTGEEGQLLFEQLLSANSDSMTIQLEDNARNGPTISRSRTFSEFLVLGVKHIWTGYDHLLFLFGLLIVTRNFVSALKIITCFTLAHSITLAIATLSLAHFSSKIVEPLIAASIVYVGIENLFRGDDTKGRWLLAFGFGLIHGFGFASVLRELGVGSNGGSIMVPLVSFNLGVELGQIAVASLALPVIWRLRKRPVYLRRWVPAGSAAVAVLGTWWFVQRVWF